MARRAVRSREIVADARNLRDYGLTSDRRLLALVQSLASREGWCFATTGALRAMFEQDCGHLPGVGTLDRTTARHRAQGLVLTQWLAPGQVLPDGSVCTHGLLLRRASVNRAQVRSTRAWNATHSARERVQTRVVRGASVSKLLAAPDPKVANRSKVGTLPPSMGEDETRRRQQSETERALALALAWAEEEKEKPPP